MITDPDDRERFYDDEVAPVLLRLAGQCKAQGMPMVCAVYFDGERSGLTQVEPDGDNPSWLLTRMAWSARGNLDSLCITAARSVEPWRNGSIFAHRAAEREVSERMRARLRVLAKELRADSTTGDLTGEEMLALSDELQSIVDDS